MPSSTQASLKEQRVPGPPKNLILGNLAEYRQNRLGFEKQIAKEYGDIVHVRIVTEKLYLISHPDDIQSVLVKETEKYHKARMYRILFGRLVGNGLFTSEGDFWKRQRKLVQPAFHTKRIQAYAETMVNYTQTMLDAWQDGQTKDISGEMMHLTLNIVVKSLFSTEIGVEADKIEEAVTQLLEATSDTLESPFQLLPQWIPIPRNIKIKRYIEQLNKIVYRIIREHRLSSQDTGDLLSMLLQATDDNGEQMTDKQLRDEVITLILAGHETTSNALMWTWYLLSQHPEIEAKLHEELRTVLGGRPPVLEDLPRLEYTAMIFKEALRLYPPFPTIAREAQVPVNLGGYNIAKGSIIIISPHIFHMDKRWWDEPAVFNPERFAKSNEKNINRYAYLPFGGGPRVCIGNNFAQMEAVLLIATIAQRYRLGTPPIDDPISNEIGITLRSKEKMMMRLEKRVAD